MRHFIQYHNTEKMGYSASTMTELRMVTDKSVKYLPSNAVWLISGAEKSPKTFSRDKTNLDIFWLKDDSLEDSESLPPPDIIAQEIVEQLKAALNEYRLVDNILSVNAD